MTQSSEKFRLRGGLFLSESGDDFYETAQPAVLSLERKAVAQRYPHPVPHAAADSMDVFFRFHRQHYGTHRRGICLLYSVCDHAPHQFRLDASDASPRRTSDRLALPHFPRPERQGHQHGARLPTLRGGASGSDGTYDLYLYHHHPPLRRQRRQRGRCASAGRKRRELTGTAIPAERTGYPCYDSLRHECCIFRNFPHTHCSCRVCHGGRMRRRNAVCGACPLHHFLSDRILSCLEAGDSAGALFRGPSAGIASASGAQNSAAGDSLCSCEHSLLHPAAPVRKAAETKIPQPLPADFGSERHSSTSTPASAQSGLSGSRYQCHLLRHCRKGRLVCLSGKDAVHGSDAGRRIQGR